MLITNDETVIIDHILPPSTVLFKTNVQKTGQESHSLPTPVTYNTLRPRFTTTKAGPKSPPNCNNTSPTHAHAHLPHHHPHHPHRHSDGWPGRLGQLGVTDRRFDPPHQAMVRPPTRLHQCNTRTAACRSHSSGHGFLPNRRHQRPGGGPHPGHPHPQPGS